MHLKLTSAVAMMGVLDDESNDENSENNGHLELKQCC